MSVITRRLSVSELSQQILEMAKTGIYRESVFEALQPLATKRQIRAAIAHAKRFGLHSVANLRDAELGTYYQLDLVKHRSLQHAIHSTAHLSSDIDLMERMTAANQTIEHMLKVAKGLAVVLLAIAALCWLMGQGQISLGLMISALSAMGIWTMQKAFAKKII
jgi:hypothetical protein